MFFIVKHGIAVYNNFIPQERKALFSSMSLLKKCETLIENYLLIHTREPCRLLNFENCNVNKTNAIKQFKGPTSKQYFVHLL